MFFVLFLFKKAQGSARFTVAGRPGPSPHLRIAGAGGARFSQKPAISCILNAFSLAREHSENQDPNFATLFHFQASRSELSSSEDLSVATIDLSVPDIAKPGTGEHFSGP